MKGLAEIYKMSQLNIHIPEGAQGGFIPRSKPSLKITPTQDFNLAEMNAQFERLNFEQRLQWAQDKFGDGLVLSSSFGIQSAILLKAVTDNALDVPVIAVDIHDPKYDQQREYRERIQGELGFDLYIASARDDAGKVGAMAHGLKALGATAVISGIRASQTANRAQKKFIEVKSSGEYSVHPILDWPDARADMALQKMPDALRHKDYKPGVQSIGGAVLKPGEVKKECGLHYTDGAGI